MNYLELLRSRLDTLSEQREAHVNSIREATDAAAAESRTALNDAETQIVTSARDAIAAIEVEIFGENGTRTEPAAGSLAARIAELEVIEAGRISARRAPVVNGTLEEPTDVRDVRYIPNDEARNRALAMVERSPRFMRSEHREAVSNLIRGGGSDSAAIARLALLTGSETYARAWMLYMTGRSMEMTERERMALAQGMDTVERNMSAGTQNTGGYFVPVFLDPTMIITGAGSIDPMRDLATVRTIGPAYGGFYGVTAAQVTAAWTAEGNAAPDNTPVVGSPNIPVYQAEAHVAASYQAFDDIGDLAADVANLFADAKANLEALAFVTGSGSSQPTGIVTAISADAGALVASATSGVLVLDDATKLQNNMLPRHRRGDTRLAYMANIAIMNKFRSLAMAQNSANSVWTDVAGPVPPRLFGVDIYEASSMSGTLTTGQDILVHGNFRRYVIVDRVGFSTEFIPNYFDTSTGRPTATRGWLSRWRTGGNAVDVRAFRMLRL